MAYAAALPTLPLELGGKIVEMTSWKDDVWNNRVQDPGQRRGHINCMSSLALVKKAFRSLVAKYQFKVQHPYSIPRCCGLKNRQTQTLSSKKAVRPVFRWRLITAYGHHFTDVAFV